MGEVVRGSRYDLSKLLRFCCRLALAVLCSCTLLLLQSCGGMVRAGLPLAELSPAAGTLQVGADLNFKATSFYASSPGTGVPCDWSSSNPAVLISEGKGRFRGYAPGAATVVAQCTDADPLSASVLVTTVPPGPIVITAGGTYSGAWTSDDPAVPAVSILTDQPVILHDAVITSRGDLINIDGTGSGAHVTVEDVTGTALDPGSAGMQRGAFLTAQNVASLHVAHCSMSGVSYGIRVLSSTLSALSLTRNTAREMEDRASDGAGGLEPTRPSLGHFIYLHDVSAPSGAEIAWNEAIDTIGSSSTEDVINIYKSQGSAAAPIRVHDNYMEGYSSTTTAAYTGAGLIADGDSMAPVTAFVSFETNQMVHTAGSGVEIAGGHDILARGNRVVSCGMDAQGKWFAMPFVNAAILWNYYAAPDFYNNVVKGTKGGMLKPDANGQAITGDIWVRTSDLNATDLFTHNHFTDPCLSDGKMNLEAEDAERARWAAKLSAANITLGDQHHP